MRTALLLVATIAMAAQESPERRARHALDSAEQALNAARDAYAKGDAKETETLLGTVLTDVGIASDSLNETGKDPRRKPKYFKFGEVRTRDLLKRLEALEKSMDFDDRKIVEPVKAKVQEVHDRWFLGIMGEKQ